MTEPVDRDLLIEAVRQGERILHLQDSFRESILRRSGELLRLSIATIGGVLVLGGILATAGTRIGPLGFLGFVSAVALQVGAAWTLAIALSGGRIVGDFVWGTDLQRLAEYLRTPDASLTALLTSLGNAQPDWVEDNNRLLSRLQRLNGLAVLLLASGSLILLVTLYYILGGTING